ncbi:hypothetical protein HanRHA438_Chr02g0048581 [Helianthus annuus]|nr:hypothetical protein HanRHA438_Chr02g0048581 [Helianthus annuus]
MYLHLTKKRHSIKDGKGHRYLYLVTLTKGSPFTTNLKFSILRKCSLQYLQIKIVTILSCLILLLFDLVTLIVTLKG